MELKMMIRVKNIINVQGSAIESNWRYPVQIVATETGELYINTPNISGDTFQSGETYTVGVGNLFGKSGKSYRTISVN